MTLFPSIKCFFNSCDNKPSNSLHLYEADTLFIYAVTSLFFYPGFNNRRATYAEFQAANIASAFLPVTTSSLLSLQTIVWATRAI